MDLNEKNQRVREEIEQRQQTKQANRQKLADMINEFNRLMEEQRFEEAEMIAKRCKEARSRQPGRHASLAPGEVRPPASP